MSEHEHHKHYSQPNTHDCDGEGHEHHHHEDGTCCCEHHAKQFHGMSTVMKLRLIVSVILFFAPSIFPVPEEIEKIFMVFSAVIAGYDVFYQAFANLIRRKFFDEYFLMTFAVIAAFIVGEFHESAGVIVLYRIGETCQNYAIRRSRRDLFTITGSLDTGEKFKAQDKFISAFSRIYTPIVLICAALTAVLLPVLTDADFYASVYKALSFVVLACPCAIVISVPLAYCAGISAAANQKIFFADSSAVDSLAKDIAPVFTHAHFHKHECESYGDGAVLIHEDSSADSTKAHTIAKRTRGIAFQNIIFVIIIKLAVVLLSIIGTSPLWFAVFADSGVTVIAVLNSLRAFKI